MLNGMIAQGSVPPAMRVSVIIIKMLFKANASLEAETDLIKLMFKISRLTIRQMDQLKVGC